MYKGRVVLLCRVQGQDSITMLCTSRLSADVPVKGAGKLVIKTE
jgi:hypothetical protein